jgi:N-methylhydantoinase A
MTYRRRFIPTRPYASSPLNPGVATNLRRVYFGPEYGFMECPVYDRYRLAAGAPGEGPALMEERETTVVIGPRGNWTVDAYRNLLVDL